MLNKNYLTKPILYNTGFLLDDKELRIKQGLLPQGLSNNCYVNINQPIKNEYISRNIEDNNLLKNPYYNNVLFPIKQPFVNYGIPPIPYNCPCLRNMRAP